MIVSSDDVSLNTTECHSSGEVSKFFSLFLKTCDNEADVTSLDRVLHTLASATGKARLPTVYRRLNGMSIRSVDADLRL